MRHVFSDGMFRIGIVAALFWAVGTNLLDPRWYVLHGLSVGDLLFGAWFMMAMLRESTRQPLRRALLATREHATLMVALVLLLLLWNRTPMAKPVSAIDSKES